MTSPISFFELIVRMVALNELGGLCSRITAVYAGAATGKRGQAPGPQSFFETLWSE
jgi:hypothetical protein